MRDSLPIIVKNIPSDIKEDPQWVGYDIEWNEQGKKTKVPKNMIKGFNASTKKPGHWVPFETCVKYMHRFDGIGFVTTSEDPYSIWDFDGCCDFRTGFISKEIWKIIRQLNSYTEYSPSGKGLRCIVKAEIAPFGRRNLSRKIEVYDSKQYLTITGQHLKGTPHTIKRRDEICQRLHKEIFAPQIRNALKSGKNKRIHNAWLHRGFNLFSNPNNTTGRGDED